MLMLYWSKAEHGEMETARRLRDLYAEHGPTDKLVGLLRSSHELLAEKWPVDLNLAGHLIETLQKDAGGAGFVGVLAAFAMETGHRQEEAGDLEQASVAYRAASKLSPSQETRALLCNNLLAKQTVGKTSAEDKSDLRALLAEEGRFTTLVKLWAEIGSDGKDVASTWSAQKVKGLAQEFHQKGDLHMAGQLFLELAIATETGNPEESYDAYSRAFRAGNAQAEEGLKRMAIEVGCVEYAAADFLSPLLGGNEQLRSRVIQCFAMLKGYLVCSRMLKAIF